MRNTLSKRECEKKCQQLLNDSRPNFRLIGISEKSDNNAKDIKNLLTEVIAEDTPNMEK